MLCYHEMKDDKAPKKSRGGEQFADPLAWNSPDRPPGPPVNRSRAGPGIDPADRREREINQRILQEYGGSPLDAFKPFIAAGLVGMIVFSQVDRTHMLNAVIYTVMAMLTVGSIYVMIARDSLPPLISILFRGCFVLGLIAVVAWFIVNHTDTFKPRDEREKIDRKYNPHADAPN